MTIGDTAHMVKFLIVLALSPHNCILGGPALNQLQARVSTCDLSIEVPTGEEVHVIYGDKKSCPRMLFC